MPLTPVEHQVVLNSSENNLVETNLPHYAVLDLFRLKVKNSSIKSAHRS